MVPPLPPRKPAPAAARVPSRMPPGPPPRKPVAASKADPLGRSGAPRTWPGRGPMPPPTTHPPRPLKAHEKALVLILLAVGFFLLVTLLRRGHAGVGPVVRVAPAPSPVAHSTIDSVREGFASSRPFNAVRGVLEIMETSQDQVTIDLALQELEEHMESLDRLTLYKVVDTYTKEARSHRGLETSRFVNALMATKTFLFEKQNAAKAEGELTALSADKESVLAPFALSKLASIKLADDPKTAIELFRRMLVDFPASPLDGFASLMVGTCLRALDRDKEALEQYKQTLARYKNAHAQRGLPLEPFIRHALGDTYIRLGDRDSARGELTIVHERFKEYPYAGIVEETLKNLGT